MRILHLTRDLPPASKGGISTAVGGLVRALVGADQSCAALSFDGWRPRSRGGDTAEPMRDTWEGVSVLRLSSPDHLVEATRFAHAYRPDLIHVHHGMLWPFAASLREALSRPAAFTVHVHQSTMNRLRGVSEETMSLAGQRRALQEADGVCAPSTGCAAAVSAEHPDRQVVTTGLGVHDTLEARAAVSGRSTRPGGPLLYVGRFSDVKGTAEFFALARAVLGACSDARAVVVGGVPDNPRAERRWQRRWQDGASPDVVSRLRFAGWQSPSECSAHYAAARVLVVPSWTETFGLTVLEGMLHATPIVATACPAIESLLEDGRTGLLASPRDVEALVEHTMRLWEAPALGVSFGEAAAIDARAFHLWGQVVGSTIAAYEQMTGA